MVLYALCGLSALAFAGSALLTVWLIAARRQLAWYSTALEFAGAGVWAWDLRRDRWHWSDRVFQLRDFEMDDRRTVPGDAEFYARVHPSDRDRLKAVERGCFEGKRSYNLEHRTVMRSGAVRWLRNRGDVVKDGRGRPKQMMGVVIDITAEKQLASDLEHQSMHDGLTGLPNRGHLERHLGAALSRAEQRDGAVIVAFLDLNGFKSINDRFGHAAGDSLLVDFSALLRKRFRRPDFVGRIGGDEFVVVAECPRDGTVACRKRVQEKLSKIFDEVQSRPLGRGVGVAIGFAQSPTDGISSDALLGRADQAMYGAKATGLNIAFQAA